MSLLVPRDTDTFLVVGTHPNFLNECMAFWSQGIPHVTIAVNKAGFQLLDFQFWYSWHQDELKLWAAERRYTGQLLSHSLGQSDVPGLGISILGGSSVLDAVCIAIDHLGARQVVVAGCWLDAYPHNTFLGPWIQNRHEIGRAVRFMDGPLTELIGRWTTS